MTVNRIPHKLGNISLLLIDDKRTAMSTNKRISIFLFLFSSGIIIPRGKTLIKLKTKETTNILR